MDSDSHPRPDILVYMVDTLRADELEPYGAAVTRTPNLARFAEEAALFERAYALSANTRASIASFLTGVAPLVHGAENTFQSLGRDASLARLPGLLAEAGYATAAVVANPNVATVFGFDVGFGRYEELYSGAIEAGPVLMGKLEADGETVLKRVRSVLAEAQRDKPLFLFVLSIDPHSPYDPPGEYDVLYDPDVDGERDGSLRAVLSFDRRLERGRTPSPDKLRALYRGEVTYSDQVFGQLLNALEDEGRLDQTLIVFTADHGEEFVDHGRRGHGKSLYEEVTRVPLIVRYPAMFDAGTREGMVDLTDVAATLLSVAGAEAPPYWRGRDLRGNLPAQPIFSSLRKSTLELATVRFEGRKAIRNLRSGACEYFDLVQDPAEEDPLTGARAQAAAVLLDPLLEEFQSRALELRGRLVGSGGPSEPLSPELEESLRALGYAR